MKLKIFCEDESIQIINLHSTFVTERMNGRGDIRNLLSFSECNRKAMISAQSIVGEDNYKHHTLMGYDDTADDIIHTH